MEAISAAITASDFVFIGAGLVGMVCHYLKKYTKNETDSSFKNYFGKDNLNATINTFGAFGMAILAALSSGVIADQMTLWSVIYIGLTTGWAVDSGFNSSAKTDTIPTEK